MKNIFLKNFVVSFAIIFAAMSMSGCFKTAAKVTVGEGVQKIAEQAARSDDNVKPAKPSPEQKKIPEPNVYCNLEKSALKVYIPFELTEEQIADGNRQGYKKFFFKGGDSKSLGLSVIILGFVHDKQVDQSDIETDLNMVAESVSGAKQNLDIKNERGGKETIFSHEGRLFQGDNLSTIFVRMRALAKGSDVWVVAVAYELKGSAAHLISIDILDSMRVD